MAAYQDAVIKQIKDFSPHLDEYIIDTVYFGGGTPGYYGADRLADVYNTLKKYDNIAVSPEVTVEVNPGDVKLGGFERLRGEGFNRLSIGVQSADDKTLKNIGRRHTFADAEETVSVARQAGFDNISVDLIYGLPEQDIDGWAETLARIVLLKTEHISLYGLKIEEGTRLFEQKESLAVPGDDAQADMYLYAVDMLAQHGYIQYEISNAARRGYQSKHNMKYWLCDEYIGFGPGAHSYFQGRRFSFVKDVANYITQVTSGLEARDYCEEISDAAHAEEYLMLRLRTTHGVSDKEYYDSFGRKMDPALGKLREYELHGWALARDGRWRFTPKGFMLSNTLIGEILAAQEKQVAE